MLPWQDRNGRSCSQSACNTVFEKLIYHVKSQASLWKVVRSHVSCRLSINWRFPQTIFA